MSQQGLRQASVRAVTGTTLTYEGDWHALFDMDGIPSGPYNQRLLAWINQALGTNYTELNGAMQAFATDQGAYNWSSMGTFSVDFSPENLSGLNLWLDAADTATITQVAGAVSQWNDKSGNSYHATQGTGANQPITNSLTVNGLNALLLDGTNDFLTVAAGFNAIAGGNQTTFAVYKTDLSQTKGWIIGGIQTIFWGLCQNNTASSDLMAHSGGGFPLVPRVYDSSQHMMTMNRNGAVLTGGVDGTYVAGTGTSGLVLAVTIGQLGGAEYYKGGICEIITYNRSLSAAEQTQVENYLRTKWNTPNPLMAIATQNRNNQGADSIALNDAYAFRVPMQIGTNAGSLVVNVNNWLMAPAGEQATGNAFTISDMSIEAPNGTVVPVKWATATSKVIANDANDINSDEIFASQFGQTVSRGDLFWIKGKLSVTAGDKVPFSDTLVGEVSGTQFYWYIAATTTASSTTSAGIYTFTGVAPTGRLAGFRPMLIGRPLVNGPSFIQTGDSIGTSANDVTDFTATGRAFFQRSMRNAANNGDYLPSMNFALNGIGYGNFSGTNTRWRGYIKYCKYGFDELGTNDVGVNGDVSLATLQTRATTHWALFTANGSQKVLRSCLLTRTTSTDSWATAGNQTVSPGWVAGSVPILFNAWLQTKVSDGTLYAAVNFDSAVLNASDRTLWLTNGSPNFPTNDGTHPLGGFHELMAVVLRVILRLLS